MSTTTRVAWVVLVLLSVASLAANFYLFGQLQQARGEIEGAVASAAASERQVAEIQRQLDATHNTAGLALDFLGEQLGMLESQVLTVTVPIDEEIPVAATIPFDEVFTVPIQTSVPIDTAVNVPLQLGLLGTYNLDIPIRTTVPIDLEVEVPIRKRIPIETTVPIRFDVPVTLSLAGTPLGEQLAGWGQMLQEMRASFR